MAVSTLAAGGCVLPPPIDEEPVPHNLAPRIAFEGALSPDPSRADNWPLQMYVDTQPPPRNECADYPFNISVADPDPLDTIYWRVFLDYSANTTKVPVEEGEIPPPEDGISDLPQKISFTVSPLDVNFKYGCPTGGCTGTHWVELLVADRPFELRADPVGRSVSEDGKMASFIWTVNIVEVADCP